jgi:hypothetical protein
MGDRRFTPKPLGEILTPQPPATRNFFHWRGQPGEIKPLWAILGEGPPYDWRPPNVRDDRWVELAAATKAAEEREAPDPGSILNPGDQRGPGVWLVEHPILGAGPAHTAIEYVSEDGRREWISAGPDKGRLVSGVGTQEQTGEVTGDRPTDAPRGNMTVERRAPPDGMTSADFWGELKRRDANFHDNIDYDLVPDIQDSFNSNSYTRGLLDASGATYTAPFDDYVGGKDPVPPSYFDPPYRQDRGSSGGLRPPYRRRLPRPN